MKSESKKGNAYGQVLKYTGAFGVVQIINILLGMVRNKCVAVFLGPAGMGFIDVFNRAAEFVGSATNLGLGVSSVKRFSELRAQGDEEGLRQAVMITRSWGVVAAAFGLLLGLAFAPVLSRLTFGDYSFTLHFMAAAPMVPMLTITAIELAILKGLRRLRRIAVFSLCSAVAVLVVTVVLVMLMGMEGIVPILLLTTLCMMCFQLYGTHDLYPWRTCLRSSDFLRRGLPLIKVGVAFNMAAILTSGGEMLIRSYMVSAGSVTDVGLYSAGFLITVAYARLVFVAVDADYYPRLSAVQGDRVKANDTVNRQIEVYVLLMGPFLAFFLMALPVIIPLLYDVTYIDAIPLTMAASFYMLFKAVSTPIGYISLARADARTFLVMEFVSVAVFVGLVIVLFGSFGLLGAGVALSLSNLCDALVWGVVYGRRYGYAMPRATFAKVAVQTLLVGCTLALCLMGGDVLRYAGGSVVLALSVWYSYRELSKDTVWSELIRSRFLRGRK